MISQGFIMRMANEGNSICTLKDLGNSICDKGSASNICAHQSYGILYLSEREPRLVTLI